MSKTSLHSCHKCEFGTDNIDCTNCKLGELAKKSKRKDPNDIEEDDYSISEKLTEKEGGNTILMLFIIALLTFILVVFFSTALKAQTVRLLPPHDMHQWGIPAGNYSGITPIGNNHYAIISDKQKADGWHEVSIHFNAKGDIASMTYHGFHSGTSSLRDPRDAEGIAYTGNGTLFISAESDQQIQEYDMHGNATGRRLNIPDCFALPNIRPNYGFEALAYDAAASAFWTTTEQSIKLDADTPTTTDNPIAMPLRLQAFSATTLMPTQQYAYLTDAPRTTQPSRYYRFGVPSITVLNDTSLLVMERELNVPNRYNHSFCTNKLYIVNPQPRYALPHPEQSLKDASAETFLPKTKLTEFTTRIEFLGKKDYANYEGMCLGPKLADGTQSLILVADSQDRTGNALFHIKDYIRIILIKD